MTVENTFSGEQRLTAVVSGLPSMWDSYVFVVSACHKQCKHRSLTHVHVQMHNALLVLQSLFR